MDEGLAVGGTDTAADTRSSFLRLPSDESADRARIEQAVAAASAHRAVIDQAKGMLSVIYDIDADAAFALLRWRSQTANVKLRTLAEQLIVDFRGVNSYPLLPARSTYDHLLMTGHERVGDATD